MRVLVELLPFFLAPYIAYMLWLAVQRRWPLLAEHWSRGVVSWLALAGLACTVAALLALGATRGQQRGAYQPAVMQDGKLVPGHFE